MPDLPTPVKSRASRAASNTDCNGCYVPPPPGMPTNCVIRTFWFFKKHFHKLQFFFNHLFFQIKAFSITYSMYNGISSDDN